MNMSLMLAVVIAFASCATLFHAGMGFVMDDPDVQAKMEIMKTNLCNETVKPTDDQWTEIIKCEPKLVDHKDKVVSRLQTCIDAATDVDSVKTDDVIKNLYIFGACSQAFKDCQKEMFKKYQEKKAGGEAGGEAGEEKQLTDEQKTERKDKWKGMILERIDCVNKQFPQ